MVINRIIALGLGYVIGVVFASNIDTSGSLPTAGFWIIMAAGTAWTLWTIRAEYNWRWIPASGRYIPLALAAFALGNLITTRVLNVDNTATRFFAAAPANQPVEMRGWIAAEPESRGDSRVDLRLRVSQTRLPGGEWIDTPETDVQVKVFKPRDDAEIAESYRQMTDSEFYGRRVEVAGVVEKPMARINPGGFDMEAFVQSEGYAAVVKVFDWRQPAENRGGVSVLDGDAGYLFIKAALAAKRRFLEIFKETMPPPESLLVSGATLGMRFALRGEEYRGKNIEDSFRHSGVGHALAVSGLHISVVSLLLFSLFRMTRVPPKYFTPLMILLLFAFTFLTGARPSSVRASIMNSMIIIMFVYGGAAFGKAAYAGMALSSFLILLARPLVLYTAGFLLSFGAVFSLVLLTRPIDNILKHLRGAVLALAVAWYAAALVFACFYWDVFILWETLMAAAAALLFLVWLGELLNRRHEVLLALRLDRLPEILRMFIAAQLAIQVGMMIPMSAFFFGNFPIAGSFVNFAAIPLVGVLVQLGLLIGLVGAIPLVGAPIALVFGATNFLAAKLFIIAAWLGSEVFPFPTVPTPSMWWMIGYYILVLAAASSVLWWRHLHTAIYRLHSRRPVLVEQTIPIGLVVLLLAGAGARATIAPPKAPTYTIDILAGSTTPVLVVSSNDHRAGGVLLNSGSGFFAKTAVKSTMLKRGANYLAAGFASGHGQELGSAGFAELAAQMRVDRLVLPAFAGHAEPLPEFADAAAYFDAVDERRLAARARSGNIGNWNLRQYVSYEGTQRLAASQKTEAANYAEPASFQLAPGVEVETLTAPYRSFAVGFMLRVGGKSWLVVPDPANRALAKVPEAKLACDVLVLGGPHRGNLRFYEKSLDTLLGRVARKEVVLCLDGQFADAGVEAAIKRAWEIIGDVDAARTRTDRGGYVSATVPL